MKVELYTPSEASVKLKVVQTTLLKPLALMQEDSMPISLKHIMLIIGFTLSAQACATEKPIYRDTQFIVQLTDTIIRKLQDNTFNVKSHRNTKLQQWSQHTGLELKAVPSTNLQRWIIKASTQNPDEIKKLVHIIDNDTDVKYIEKDGIMTIQPTQRSIPILLPTNP